MPTYIDLNRRFVARHTYEAHELISSEIGGNKLTWERVLSHRFSVVIAPANSGKTTELQHRAALLRELGEHAVFVALRSVASRNGLHAALRTVEQAALTQWRTRPTSQLTMFVDSLDEASAGSKEGIGYLIRTVAEELQWPNPQVRWVISTRPAVLTAEILQEIKETLVAEGRTLATASRMGSGTAAASTSTATLSPEEPEQLHLFSLAPLDTIQAQQYLETKYPSLDADATIAAARSKGLSGFTSSPGGLDVIANTDLLTRPPESLTEVFQRVVDAVQELQRQDTRLVDVGAPVPDVRAAAQKIAAASQVCQLPNIEIPEERLGVTEGVLSARMVASSLLTERATTQLLNSQLFVDVGYHQVKMYPEELPPFLGAQRLSSLVQSPEHAHRLIDLFSWSAPTGEHGVYRQYFPLMGWLATLNPHFRQVVLQRDPQALAFFGDLRSSQVPLSDAEAALKESVRRLAEEGDSLGRGEFHLTSENFWQAGMPALLPLIHQLFAQYSNHSDARNALLSIASSVRAHTLRELVLSDHKNDFSSVARASADLQYLLEVGHEEDLSAFARMVKGEPVLADSVKALLISHLAWRHLSGREIGCIVNRHFQYGGGGFHIGWTLGSELSETATDDDLYDVARSLVASIVRGSRTQEEFGRSKSGERHVDVTVQVLAVLVRRQTSKLSDRVALMCWRVQRLLNRMYLSSSVRDELASALEESPEVRRAFLSLVVRQVLRRSEDLWMTLYGQDCLCSIEGPDVSALQIPELTEVFTERERIRVKAREQGSGNERPAQTTRPHRGVDKLEVSEAVRNELSQLVPELRDASASNGLAWVASWLLQTNPKSRYGDVRFERFEEQVGAEIGGAIRKGFSILWRTRDPKYNESEPHSTFNITAAGLQGLHLELGEGKDIPSLSAEEVRRAIRYGVFEINGYPKWFWLLVNSYSNVAMEELTAIAGASSQGAVSAAHAETLLMSLGSAPPFVRSTLAPMAWTYLREHPSANGYTVERLLAAVTEGAPAVNVEFEKAAAVQVEEAFLCNVQVDVLTDPQVMSPEHRAVVWATAWITHDPASFIQAVAAWREKNETRVDEFLFQLAAHLGRDHGGQLIALARSKDAAVETLGTLYEMLLEVVKPELDNDHSDGDAYTPDSRDNAERLRDSLIPVIASARSQRAYDVLGRLRKSASGRRAEYLHNVQFQMREDEYGRPPIRQQAYDHFERTFTTEVTDTTSFAMAVHTDLLSVKYDVEHGEHSLRRFFSEVAFLRPKDGSEGEQAGLALEADFQRLLASELHHHSKGRYSVTVEPHTAESKRRDVLCSKGNMFASIELKMSMRWTLDNYIEALEKQLVGQYMRHRGATTGFLVIVLQEKSRRWTDSSTGAKIGFAALLEILKAKALALEAQNRDMYLRVIGIDATAPSNFRAPDSDVTASASGPAGKKSSRTPRKAPTKVPSPSSEKNGG